MESTVAITIAPLNNILPQNVTRLNKNYFFLFPPFLFLPHSLSLFFISTATKCQIQSKHENNFSHKPNEIKKIKEKKKKKEKRERPVHEQKN